MNHNEIAIEAQNVWKKFKKGEKFDSLRDLIPAMLKKMFKIINSDELALKEFWALEDISFQVKRGEAVGIIGPNGAGKSTIMKLINGLLRPNKGDIRVNGRMSALIEVGAGFHFDLTGRENIYLNGAILGMRKEEIDKKLEQIIEFAEISDFVDTPVKHYSSGMYARLGFSIAAHVEPDILLVDEVLSVGDYAFQGKCIKKMSEIRESGATIIFISHNIDSIMSLCDRALLVKKGRIIAEGDPIDVAAKYYSSGGIGTACGWVPNILGSKKVFIDKTTFEGIDSTCKTLKPCTHLKCKILIKANDDVRFSPGLFITHNGILIFSTTYGRMMEGRLLYLKEGGKIELVWELDLNLPAGYYSLGLHLEDANTSSFYEHNFQAANFLIADDKRYEAKFQLNPDVYIERTD